MRRALLALSVIALSFASAPRPAAASSRAWCEGYCALVAGGCYVFLGLFAGREKCDTAYEGCVDGCIAALQED